MRMLKNRIRLLIIGLWAGSLLTIGYLVAPTLFLILPDKKLAGTIAGALFRNEAYLTVFCSLVLIIFFLPTIEKDGSFRQRKVFFYMVAAMLLCTVIGYFGIHPFFVTLKESSDFAGGMNSVNQTKFNLLHGLASALYFIQSILGVALLFQESSKST